MKKVIKSAAILATGLLIALSSCKKADEATPLEGSTGTATIKGQLLYDNNTVNDSDGNEFQDTDPAKGATIKITTYTDIIGDEDPIISTTTVGSNGSYSFSVPATAEGAYVEIEVYDYSSDFTFEYNDDGTQKEATESGYFSGFYIDDVTVYPGQTKQLGTEYFGGFTTTENPSNY